MRKRRILVETVKRHKIERNADWSEAPYTCQGRPQLFWKEGLDVSRGREVKVEGGKNKQGRAREKRGLAKGGESKSLSYFQAETCTCKKTRPSSRKVTQGDAEERGPTGVDRMRGS